jgi:hypothetical protein
VRKAAVEDGEDTGAGDAAARTEAGAGAAATGGATFGLIVGEGTALDRQDGRGAEVGRVRGGPVVEEPAAEAAAAVAGRPAGAAEVWLPVTVLPETVSTAPK